MREVKPHCEPKSSYVSLWPKLTKLYQSEATYFPTQLIFIFNIYLYCLFYSYYILLNFHKQKDVNLKKIIITLIELVIVADENWASYSLKFVIYLL